MQSNTAILNSTQGKTKPLPSSCSYPHPLTLPWDLRNTFFKLHGVVLQYLDTQQPIPTDLVAEINGFESDLQGLANNGRGGYKG